MPSGQEVCNTGNPVSEFADHDDRWCSLHIFYDAEQDNLLTHCLKPLAERLIQTGLASQLFFIRHWQGGPHIRFRFKVIQRQERNNVLSNVQENIAGYVRQRPSPLVISDEDYHETATLLAQQEGVSSHILPRQPNNSIVVSPYVPERNKYGNAGVGTAEKFFHGSSFMVFQILQNIQGLREKKLGIGFAMGVGAARAFEFSRSEASDFFYAYSQLWTLHKFEASKRQWQPNLEKNRGGLRKIALSVLKNRKSSDSRENPEWLRSWEGLLKHCQGELFASGELPPLDEQYAAMDRRKWWFLLAQYLHTHNNRLGFLPEDEGYLGLMTYEIFRDLPETVFRRPVAQQGEAAEPGVSI